MQKSIQAFAFLTAALAVAGPAGATQPPDSVYSDSFDNTAMGSYVLSNVVPDLSGGAIGTNGALGAANTGVGYLALYADTSGAYNTGVGAFSLYSDTTGYLNTGVGYGTVAYTTTGSANTGIGHDALEYFTTGNENTALGTYALQGVSGNSTGSSNTAAGFEALGQNTTGANNTAFGADALVSNSTGRGNAAQGVNALFSNTTGIRNLGIGNNALYANTTGSYNIGLGFEGGYNITTGSNNIEIGTAGTAGDNATIQIGVQGTQVKTTIAGIYGTLVTGGSAVYVTAAGQLGVQGSSERFKTDIATMPQLSDKLAALRPVTFRYRTDPERVRQYGLIAEEVAKVYPELVIRDTAGRIQGVHYEELAPMLLNEVQELQRKNAAQNAEIQDLAQEHAQMQRQLADIAGLKEELRAALRRLDLQGDLLAKR
jgi:hypothetical protein